MCLTQWGSPGLRSTSTPHTQPRLRVLPCAPGVFPSRMGVLAASRGELSDLQGSPWACFSLTAQYLEWASLSPTLFHQSKCPQARRLSNLISLRGSVFPALSSPFPQSTISSWSFLSALPHLFHPFARQRMGAMNKTIGAEFPGLPLAESTCAESTVRAQ